MEENQKEPIPATPAKTYKIEVTADEAKSGCKKTVRYKRKAADGSDETVRLSVEIPSGTRDKEIVFVSDEGDWNEAAGKKNAAVLVVKIVGTASEDSETGAPSQVEGAPQNNEPQQEEKVMAKKEMKYLDEEIISQLENLFGEISFVFSNSGAGFYVCSVSEERVIESMENYFDNWYEYGGYGGDVVFLPTPSNRSRLEIGGVSTKFDFADWNCQDRKVKRSDGKKMALLWDEGWSKCDWDAWFVLELGEGEKFCKDKLVWKTISYYDECGDLQMTIAVGAIYDGKEYDFVRTLPERYEPGVPTWIVPHGFEVPDDLNDYELNIYRMADPATISDSSEYESLDDIHLHYEIFTGDYKVDDAIEEGARFYKFLANGGEESDYDPDEGCKEKSDNEDFEIEDGMLTEYNGKGGDVVIPNGTTVIGEEAFSRCSSLTSVVIPEGVTKIGDRAFRGCDSLKQVTVPVSAELYDDAFSKGCEIVRK